MTERFFFWTAKGSSIAVHWLQQSYLKSPVPVVAASVLPELVDFLHHNGFLTKKEIGSEGKGKTVTVVNHSRLMLTVPQDVYRCNNCGNVTTHSVASVKRSDSLGSHPPRIDEGHPATFTDPQSRCWTDTQRL